MSKKNILIIGASSSIGCEIIRQIDEVDTVILAHYHSNNEGLDSLKESSKSKIIPIQADLSKKTGVDFLIKASNSICDYPDKIIFIAAPNLILKRFKDLQWSDFEDQIDMQLYAAFVILKTFLPQMAIAKYGKVLFMLSSYTIGIPPSSMAHYVTGKYAMLGLMKSLSAEYSSKNICINAISPSMIETNYLNQIPDKLIEFTAQQHPMKRNGIPADVASVVKFLLSDESEFIKGVNMPVTGGA